MILPDSLRQVIGSRVANLGESARQILPLASVIGREFDLGLLARVTERSEEEILDVLDAAATVALVEEVSDAFGRYSFSHALIQHTLYQDLGPTRRALAHRQVAEAIEAISGGDASERVAELAHHWFSATQSVEVSKAIGYAQQAAQAALAALAPDEAVRYYLQALQLIGQERDPDQQLMVDLLIGLGTSQRQAGLADFRETLLDAAHRAQNLGATDRLIVAALANNRGMFSSLGVVDTDKVQVIEAALLAMPDTDSLERALLLATLCNELTYGKPLAERQVLADEAKAMARRLGDPATIVRVLTLVEQPLEAPSTLGERVTDTIEALDLAERLGDPFHLYFAAVYRRICALQFGQFDVSTRCLGTMKALSERLRQPTLAWITRFHEAAEALVCGNLEDAERFGIEALQIGTDCGQPDAFPFYGAQLIVVRHEQGRLGEFVSVIDALAHDNAGNPSFLGAGAAAYFDAGDEGEALRLLDRAAVDDFASLPMDLAWLFGVVAYSEVAIELQSQSPAAVFHELLSPFHDQIPFNGLMPLEPVALYLGGLASVLGNFEQAEAYFIQASETTTRGVCTFSQTRVDLAWGRMLIARAGPGDLDRARHLLERARSVAKTHGYASVERRAIAALSNVP